MESIFCGYSFEASWWGTSNEYQHVFIEKLEYFKVESILFRAIKQDALVLQSNIMYNTSMFYLFNR